jgi:hypothetical protein
MLDDFKGAKRWLLWLLPNVLQLVAGQEIASWDSASQLHDGSLLKTGECAAMTALSGTH